MPLLGNRLPLTHDRVHRPWWTKKDISHSFKNIGWLTFLGHWQTAGGREQKKPRAIIKVLSSHCTKPVPRETTREGNGTPLQYSCLENPMDRGAWWAAVHGVANSQAWLSDFTFTFHFHALEKEMATHSSVLAWRIPGMGEPGGLPSIGLHRVGHNWSYLAAAEKPPPN